MQQKLERNSILLIVGIIVMALGGGIVEILPNFWLDTTIEKVGGVRPYTPLELAGRNIYVREGCYACHSQQIRPFRDEHERYGHYSLAAESMYDKPFQWGSKRTGPDLARVGGRYSDDWHVQHMIRPKDVVPESVMPGYPFLASADVKVEGFHKHLATNQILGVPYSDEMIAMAERHMRAQGNPDSDDYDSLLEAYPGANIRDFDGNPDRLTELDALIAYLQVLGTMVDFSTYDADANNR